MIVRTFTLLPLEACVLWVPTVLPTRPTLTLTPDTPELVLWKLRREAVDISPHELARRLDMACPGLSDAQLGALLPADPAHPPASWHGRRDRGRRLRGKKA